MSAEKSLSADALSFRTAMARLGAAVNVVTTDGPAGRFGLTASAVCSVTDSPPTLLVCVNRASSCAQPILDNGVLCVNVLGPGHVELSRTFATAGLRSSERFTTGRWQILETGAPALETAPVALDCRVSQVVEVGTHLVLFARVAAMRVAPDPGGLVYFNRRYIPLPAECAP